MAIDVDGGVLWLGFFRGVRVVGTGGFGRFVVFLAPLRAWLHTSESCIGDIRPGPARVRHDNARGDEYTR